MATTAKVLSRTILSTAPPQTLYTVPASTTTIVTNIAVVNTTTSDQTVYLYFEGTLVLANYTIATNSTVYLDMKQVLVATNTITGLMSSLGVSIHISGVEIT